LILFLGKGNTKHRQRIFTTEKAYRIISKRMADVDKKKLQQALALAIKEATFNLYAFARNIAPNPKGGAYTHISSTL